MVAVIVLESPTLSALVVIGVATLLMLGYRAWTLYARYNVQAAAFMKVVRRLIDTGDLTRVVNLCSAAPTALVARATTRIVGAVEGGQSAIASAARAATEEARVALASPVTTLLRLLTLCAVGLTILGVSFANSTGASAPHDELAATVSAILWLGAGVTAVAVAGQLALGAVARRLLADVERVGSEVRDVLVARSRRNP